MHHRPLLAPRGEAAAAAARRRRLDLALPPHEEGEEGGEAERRQDGSPPRTPLKSTLSAHEDLAKRGIFKTSFLANYTPSGKLGKKHHEFRLLMCGPEHAGKTTFVMQLQKKTHIAWETSHSKVEGEMSMIMHVRRPAPRLRVCGSAS